MFFATPDDDEVHVRLFQAGDIVRCQYNEEICGVIWTYGDWLWLDPVEYADAAPFSGRVQDYVLVGRT